MTEAFFPKFAVAVHGERSSNTWNCWRQDESGAIVWELYCFVKEVCRRANLHSKNFRVRPQFEDAFGGWFEWLRICGSSSQEHLVMNARSAMLREGGATELNREVHTLSTFGVLSALVWAMTTKKQVDREVAEAVFCGFIETCIPGCCLQMFPWFDLLAQQQHLCTESAQGGICVHARMFFEAREELEAEAASVFALVKCLRKWCQSRASCPACNQASFALMAMIVHIVHTTFLDREFPSDALRNAVRDQASKGKKRVHENVKSEVLAAAAKKSIGAANLASIHFPGSYQTARSWGPSQAAAHLAASWRTFEASSVPSVCVALDASRMGSPAEETVIYAAENGSWATFLPPMVSLQCKILIACQCKV
eukprot:3756966-Amphidinium_carterae.3